MDQENRSPNGRRGGRLNGASRDGNASRNGNSHGKDAPASPPPDAEAESGPRFEAWKKNARLTMAGVPRALGLVWSANRGYTALLAVFSVVLGVVPSATAWMSKLLVDAVVAAVQAGGRNGPTDAVVQLVALQFGILAGSGLMSTVRNIIQQLLQELTVIRVQLMIMGHANKLDLAFFENPQFYDALQQAQREASYRPLRMVDQTFSLVRSLITFLSMVALIASLGWIVALVALVAPIPSFIANSRYGWQGYIMTRRQSPDRRRMGYYLDLLTKDTYNKEVKLFGLGDHFIARWHEIAARFYRENRNLVTRRYLMGFIWGNLTPVVTSGTYLYVAMRTIAGQLTLGDLTFYTQAVGSVQSSLGGILGGLSDMYENSLYLTNLYNYLDY